VDEVTFVKTKFRMEQWEKLINDRQNSGLQLDEWCEKNQISRHAYYYWLRKIRKKACQSILPAISKQNTPVSFAKVELQAQQSSAAAITIQFQSATIEVRDGTSPQTIETVLRVLKEIC
jgi:transposase-like protein